jgi:hypothetical protein
MGWRIRLLILSVAAALVADSFGSGNQTPPRPAPAAVKQIDRILVHSEEPRALYDFFTGTLELPVAWPITSVGESLSAGVGIGNVMLEIFGPEKAGPNSGAPKARFSGLALEPSPLKSCLAELKLRNISYETAKGTPEGKADVQSSSSTTVTLPQFSNSDLLVFLCEYNPAFLNIYVRRNQLAGQLALSKGGPLGIKALREVVIGSPHSEGEVILWRKLLKPAEPKAPGVWNLGDGPSLRITQGESSDRILRVSLQVESLAKAREFLATKKLLSPASAGALTLNPPKIQGLRIQLSDQAR